MPWRQLKLRLSASECEVAEALLWRHGALSITSADAAGQPLFELAPGEVKLWNRITLIGLFPFEAGLDRLCRELQDALPNSPREIETLEERQWERVWQQDFRPMRFGERLWVCPSTHVLAPPDPDAVNVMLDPGLAFGSGTHPTTAMCLRKLAQSRLEGVGVIDYGCGSGILAIAAALLGAWPVFAVDHDPQALAASRENCRHNGLQEQQVIVAGPEQLPALQVDLLLANILAEPLLQLRGRFSALVKPGGMIVLSGIMEEQAEQLRKAYSEHFDFEATLLDNNWVLLSGRREA